MSGFVPENDGRASSRCSRTRKPAFADPSMCFELTGYISVRMPRNLLFTMNILLL
jgi:hypothetical protein